MQFDMPTSDTGPEAELPDDLQMLAEQLGEDALHLSALYPAQSPDQWIQTASAKPLASAVTLNDSNPAVSVSLKRSLKWAAFAASLLVAVGLSWSFWPNSEMAPLQIPTRSTPLEPLANHPTPEDQLQPSDTLVVHPVSKETHRIHGTPQDGPLTVSTGLFMTLSSSEQEALLDLMEDENLPQPSVSF